MHYMLPSAGVQGSIIPSTRPHIVPINTPVPRQMHCLGGDWYPTLGNGLLQLYKTLLGQDLAQRRLTATATRLVINAWLAFSLIVGVAYRTNLMAALILRSQPPRPETVEELVQAVDR